jgi:hypothetical protein
MLKTAPIVKAAVPVVKKTLDRSLLEGKRVAFGDNLTDAKNVENTRMIMPEYLKFNFIKKLMPQAIYDRV